MPELPDVEQFRRYFNATALHQRIRRIHVPAPSLLVDTSPQGLGHALKGRTFVAAERHGKYLFAKLDSGKWLVLHFGMSGALHYSKAGTRPKYTQLPIEFENGFELYYTAPRKLGRIALTESPRQWIDDRNLGQDALAIGEKAFVERAAQRRGSIKSWLMDQHSLAGIGNIYSDEILFQCRLHPQTPVGDLDDADIRGLYRALRRVLATAIERRAEPERLPDSYLLPHRHDGGRCPRCDTALEHTDTAGRTAWFCPRCQS